MIFAKLKAVRDTLASCKAVQTEPATFAALTEAIDELDDALVMEARTHYAANPFTLAEVAGVATVGGCYQ